MLFLSKNKKISANCARGTAVADLVYACGEVKYEHRTIKPVSCMVHGHQLRDPNFMVFGIRAGARLDIRHAQQMVSDLVRAV
jgi:hypothetical protein